MYLRQLNFTWSQALRSLTSSGQAPQEHGNAETAPSRKSYLALLLEALHESRRCQAMRIIHQYRHLIADEHRSMAAAEIPEYEIPQGGRSRGKS
jgi:hypothetical protein